MIIKNRENGYNINVHSDDETMKLIVQAICLISFDFKSSNNLFGLTLIIQLRKGSSYRREGFTFTSSLVETIFPDTGERRGTVKKKKSRIAKIRPCLSLNPSGWVLMFHTFSGSFDVPTSQSKLFFLNQVGNADFV